MAAIVVMRSKGRIKRIIRVKSPNGLVVIEESRTLVESSPPLVPVEDGHILASEELRNPITNMDNKADSLVDHYEENFGVAAAISSNSSPEMVRLETSIPPGFEDSSPPERRRRGQRKNYARRIVLKQILLEQCSKIVEEGKNQRKKQRKEQRSQKAQISKGSCSHSNQNMPTMTDAEEVTSPHCLEVR